MMGSLSGGWDEGKEGVNESMDGYQKGIKKRGNEERNRGKGRMRE